MDNGDEINDATNNNEKNNENEDSSFIFEPTKEEKFAYFDHELKLNDGNINRTISYMLVGLIKMSDLFLDFTLAQYCIERYNESPQMLIFLIKVLSYFRNKKNMFNTVLNLYVTRKKNQYLTHFIYLQAYRIKVSRQSSSAILSVMKFNEIKLLTKEMEEEFKQFWLLPNLPSITELEIFEKKRNKLNDLWIESLDENKRSTVYREENLRFIINIETDFYRAIYYKNELNKIENYKDDTADLCFLSFIMCYSSYIKHEIIDSEGNIVFDKYNKINIVQNRMKNIINNNTVNSGNNTNRDNMSYQMNNITLGRSTPSCSLELDISLEESLAKTLFTQGRIRLTMQRSFERIRPKMFTLLLFYTIFSTFVTFAILTGLYSHSNSMVKSSTDSWNNEVGELIEAESYYMKSLLSLSFLYGFETDRIQFESIGQCNLYDPNYTHLKDYAFLENRTNFRFLTVDCVNTAKHHYAIFLNTILMLAVGKIDVFARTKNLFVPNMMANLCYKENVLKPFNLTANRAIVFELLTFCILAGDKNVGSWYHNNSFWCHDIRTINETLARIIEIRRSISYEVSNQSAAEDSKILYLMTTIGIAHFVFFALPIPIIFFFYIKEINYVIRIMFATEKEFRYVASQLIYKSSHVSSTNGPHHIHKYNNKEKNKTDKSSEHDLDNNGDTYSQFYVSTKVNMKIIFYVVCTLMIFFGIMVIYEALANESRKMNKLQRDVGFWNSLLTLMKPHLIEVLINIVNSIYLTHIQTNYTSFNEKRKRIFSNLNYFENAVLDLLNDTPDVPSIMGFDEEIDNLINSRLCIQKERTERLHDIYECASLSRLFATFHSLVLNIEEDMFRFNGVFKGEELNNALHMVFVHIKPFVEKADERLNLAMVEKAYDYRLRITALYITGLVCLIVFSIMVIYTNIKFFNIFKMAIRLVRRLPPNGILSNQELLNYLTQKKGNEEEMGVSQTIINNSFDGIICCNMEGIVESINRSFINDYGYSPEQLLGQLVGNIFNSESKEKLEKQIKFFSNHECANYEDHLTCFSNDNIAVSSFVSLFELKGKKNCLVLVVRNEMDLIKRQEMAEIAKKQSQDLLDQILPPKILIMLKEGTNDVSFVVNSATVMFANIVAFSHFSSTLSPQQIMGTLSSIFGAFDIKIQQFSLVTKIKLIGDSYMAASGLFIKSGEAEKSENHALQCLEFALSILSTIEDLNFKLNLNLSIRIGINSGGPLIGGILGYENRVFDIIGDPINVASRLEHASEPGKIQISESTNNMIKNNGYITIPRGDIFLKGKGNMKAFYLMPFDTSSCA